MRTRLLVIAAALGIGLSATPTPAHHSMGTYDSSTLVTIKGTVTRIEWRNPHAWIHLNAMTEDGRTLSRQIEVAGPSSLVAKGVDKTLLSIGDAVTLEAWLPKDSSFGQAPAGRTLILADGRRFDVGDNWGLR